jgi:hypothetical protein
VIPACEVDYSEDGIYGDFTYGSPGASRGLVNAMFITQGGAFAIVGKPKALVIGAGNGYEIAQFKVSGFECFGIDLYVPDIPIVKETSVRGDASSMPFRDNEFPLVYCGETFEHIPEEICWKILSEVKRVGEAFYFTIATRGDEPYNSHINIHPGWWWMKKFEEHGLEIAHAEINSIVSILYAGSGIVKMRFNDGVTIYGRCDS